MKASHKISVGVCDPGMVNGAFAFTLIQLVQNRGERFESFIRIKGSGLLSKQRNRVVTQFLDKTKSDWLLMIDSDEQLGIREFDALIDTAHDKERPVVSGLVFAGFGQIDAPYPKPVPAIFKEVETGFEPLYNYPKRSVFQVDAVGTGCLLVHRDILQRMRDEADPNQGKDWCWFWDGPINGDWVGEDLLFCRRLRSMGVPITVNSSVILPHQKSFWMQEVHNDIWQNRKD
jgi:hypothetical protein